MIERVDALTKPTRGRVVLWLALALLWALFLPQDLAMDPHHRHVSIGGAVFWALVLAALLGFAWRTHSRVRRPPK